MPFRVALAPAQVFNLTTELIVGSAPPEKSGAASGISETAAELGLVRTGSRVATGSRLATTTFKALGRARFQPA